MQKLTLVWTLSMLAVLGGFHAETKAAASEKAKSSETPVIVLQVRDHPEAELFTELEIHSDALHQLWFGGRNRRFVPARTEHLSEYTVLVKYDGSSEAYHFIPKYGALYQPDRQRFMALTPEAVRSLNRHFRLLRGKHYGQLEPWDSVKHHIRKYDIVTVTDLESGISFRAQRRAGSRHADVQPLTKEDTKRMKEIYGGRWSWNRRAILVRHKDKVYAASMHGMPHGGDGIPDNGFSGHFCIHFLGSTTHRSKETDLHHQLMVYKAGGELERIIGQAAPEQLADLFLAALQMQDRAVLQKVFPGIKLHMTKQTALWDTLRGIRKAKRDGEVRFEPLAAADSFAEIRFHARIIWEGKREERRLVHGLLQKTAQGSWTIAMVNID